MTTKDNLATKKDVQQIVTEATDAILTGMQQIIDSQNVKIDENSNKLDKLQTEFKFMRDDIKGLEGELASTVSKTEFHALKSRVDKFHPAN